jgi:hypothetical protein
MSGVAEADVCSVVFMRLRIAALRGTPKDVFEGPNVVVLETVSIEN